jgi:arylsulfatase A-like enzyme
MGATQLVPATAGARCTNAADLQALSRSTSRALRCEQRRVRTGVDAPCSPPRLPACADGALDQVRALVRADRLPPSGLGVQRACQRTIVRAARRFLVRRILERAAGERPQGRSRRAMSHVARRCAVDVARHGNGATLPTTGGACTGAIGAPGTAVDGRRLASCLRPALERIVDALAPAPIQPSIVVVLTDDQRWDTLGYMPAVTEELLARGIEFTHSFVTTSLCCPSRASFYTGQYAHTHGTLTNGPPNGGASAFRAESTLPVWLTAAGYRTALLGKYMNGNDLIAPAIPPGWGEWQTFVENGGDGSLRVFHDYTLNENGVLVSYGSDPADYSTDLLRRRAVDYIRANTAAPFFLVYAPFAPHSPATPAPRHAGSFADLPPWRPPNWNEPDVSDKPVWVRFQASIAVTAGIEATDELRIQMLESLLAVDDAVRAIARTLEKHGLTDQTVVVFTSDNGFMWREHWWTWKAAAYEESIRVPLVLRYPALLPLPRQQDGLVLNIDLAPTLLELAGAPVPSTVEGRSLLGALRGEPWREDFMFENPNGIIVRANEGVRTTQFKFIRTLRNGFEELYDLALDPYELENRASDPHYATVRAALVARLAELKGE